MATTLFATTYARITGVLLVLTGIVGIASLQSGYIGLVARDFLLWDQTHNALHIALGIIALVAGFAPRVLSPLLYSKVFGVVYVVLAGIGFGSADVLGLGTSLGLHLETGENLLHLLLGAVGLLAGFYVIEGEVPTQTGATVAETA
jgi:hypothetical protein